MFNIKCITTTNKIFERVLDITDLSFEGLRNYLEVTDIEGIVFHDKLSDKMCKIRKSDFGIKR